MQHVLQLYVSTTLHTKSYFTVATYLDERALSGYKVGRSVHSKYLWVGQYEPSCLKIPSSVFEDKL